MYSHISSAHSSVCKTADNAIPTVWQQTRTALGEAGRLSRIPHPCLLHLTFDQSGQKSFAHLKLQLTSVRGWSFVPSRRRKLTRVDRLSSHTPSKIAPSNRPRIALAHIASACTPVVPSQVSSSTQKCWDWLHASGRIGETEKVGRYSKTCEGKAGGRVTCGGRDNPPLPAD